jgi:hypothetical protein
MTRHRLRAAALAFGLAFTTATAGIARADVGVRRYALVIGANDGGPERATLRYAETDARTVASVMTELGGVQPSDRVVVLDPDKAALIVALGELRQRIQAAGDQRTEVIVYYSGHSDDRGLLLRTQRFTYKELRDALQNLDSDVRIAILDSCASGAMVTGKGGRHVAGFLENEANQVAGHAYLTSSAADEVSQEAESLGGSYFTHALVTGLRGAADINTDKLVTLNEAYRFAFEETLARTESSRFGAQHANFDIQLSGSGDLVMTDLRTRNATLMLDEAMTGRVFLRDNDGRLVAELGKPAGREVSLLLEPGKYKVSLEQDDATYVGMARVDGARPAYIAFSDLAPTAVVATTARGTGSTREDFSSTLTRVMDGAVSSMDGLDVDIVASGEALTGTAIGLGATRYTHTVSGLQLALGANIAGHDLTGVQLAVGANAAGGTTSGMQGAAGLNIVHEMRGAAQVSSGVNIAERGGRGVQVSAGANITGGDMDGVQATAGTNITGGDQVGAQLAAGFNVTGGAMQGAQVAAGLNVAHGLAGYQGAVVNVAGNGRGTQTGVLNVAGDFDGAMVGIVNIAKSTDAPIGLLNIIGEGIHALEVGSDGTGLTGSLKLGGEHIYTSYSGRYAPEQPDIIGDWSVGLAIGGRSKTGPLQSDLDLGVDTFGHDMWSSSNKQTVGSSILAPRLKLALGLPLFDGHIAPYAAAALVMGIAVDGTGQLPEFLPKWTITDAIGVWPEGSIGLRLAI